MDSTVLESPAPDLAAPPLGRRDRSTPVRVTIIATHPPTGHAEVLEGVGADEVEAAAAARARVPLGWRTVSIRRH